MSICKRIVQYLVHNRYLININCILQSYIYIFDILDSDPEIKSIQRRLQEKKLLPFLRVN